MPLPPLTPPTLRSSRMPNPFDRAQPERLRVLVDKLIVDGPVDGAGEFQGYPFLGSGSTGYPDPAAVLRSYFTHPALEVLRIGDQLHEDGDVFLGEPHRDPGYDTFSIKVKTGTGIRHTGIWGYTHAVREAADLATQHGISTGECHDGVMLYRIGAQLEADLIVTERAWLLSARGRAQGDQLLNVVSPAEALALIGLYLRWHHQKVVIGGATMAWHPASMRRSAAFTAMPAFERWNQAGRRWHDRMSGGDLTMENLNQTLLTRTARAFQFRDAVFALSATMAGHEPEDMLCELDSLLFSLVGAFDVAARITDLVLHLNGGRRIGWQYTRPDGWQAKLEAVAKDLFGYTRADTEMQRVFRVLRLLRNSVHNEALDLTTDDKQFYLTVEQETQAELREFLRAGHTGWSTADLGIRVQPPGGATAGKWLPGTGRYSVTVRRSGTPRPADPLDGTLVVDVRRFINKLFPACLSALHQIMRLTPLTGVPGYDPSLENPSRVNLPWQFSDTTGHRLRMLYGITEVV